MSAPATCLDETGIWAAIGPTGSGAGGVRTGRLVDIHEIAFSAKSGLNTYENMWLRNRTWLLIFCAVMLLACWWKFWRLPSPQQAGEKAFTATYEQVHHDSPQRSQLIVASDGQGHVRTDDGSDTFNLYDYVKRDTFTVCKSKRVYIDTRRITPGMTTAFGGYSLFDEQSIQYPPLIFFVGNEDIGGHTCRHYKGFIFFPGDRCEFWYSPDLNCCAKHSMISSGFLGHYTLTMINYDAAKPDPMLFDLTGYRGVSYAVYRSLVAR